MFTSTTELFLTYLAVRAGFRRSAHVDYGGLRTEWSYEEWLDIMLKNEDQPADAG
jgi:hypothetical protein